MSIIFCFQKIAKLREQSRILHNMISQEDITKADDLQETVTSKSILFKTTKRIYDVTSNEQTINSTKHLEAQLSKVSFNLLNASTWEGKCW